MELDRAMELALDGDAILFVGAGFSVGARNLQGSPILTGRGLAELLASKCALPQDTELEYVAEVFLDDFGADELIHVIQEQFSASAVAAYHRTFAQVPWWRIYTTNYDNVLEMAYSREGKKLRPVAPSIDPLDMPKDEPLCVHLNGYVDALTRSKIGGELKLNELSFARGSIQDSPWRVMFRSDVQLARAVLFVGYSLYDLDIRRVLIESDAIKAKCVFVLKPDSDPLTLRLASNYGTVCTISAEEVGDALRRKQSTSCSASDGIVIPPRANLSQY